MVQRSLEWPLLVLGRLGDQPLQILTLGWVADGANTISAEGVDNELDFLSDFSSCLLDNSSLEWRKVRLKPAWASIQSLLLLPKFLVVFDTEFAR